jgi:hypothetical protein
VEKTILDEMRGFTMKIFMLFSLIITTNVWAFQPRVIKKDETNSSQNELTIFAVNPPSPIDWSTPGKLLKTIILNGLKSEGYYTKEENSDGVESQTYHSIHSHFIGHMFMQLKCSGYPTVLTGMSSPGTTEMKGIMLEGKSFSQIIESVPGYFNISEKLEAEINFRREHIGNLNSMQIKMSENQCQQLLNYLVEYKSCGVDSRYGGLNANPHIGEGAGCSAFSVSFLQRLNLVPMLENLNSNEFGYEWKREINIPAKLLKNKDRDPELGAWGLIRGKDNAWATKDEKAVNVKFFDPELFSKWVTEFNPYGSKLPKLLKYLGRANIGLSNNIVFELSDSSINDQNFQELDFLKN